MSKRPFDRYMIDNEVGRNLKVMRLSVQERWAFVAGVLALAAKSTVRGLLVVADEPATEMDVANQAGVSRAVAKSTLRKLRDMGMLVMDGEYECERVHDFEDWNPPPKKDATAAERQRRLREKRSGHAPVTDVSRRDGAVGHAPVTVPVTPPEVEVEVELPPLTPPGGISDSPPVRPNGNRKTAVDEYDRQFAEWVGHHFPDAPNVEAVRSTLVFARLDEPGAEGLRRWATNAPAQWADLLGINEEKAA